ncbi:MAG: TraR/DksA family transcriptional regulator [Cytophagales bacterium]
MHKEEPFSKEDIKEFRKVILHKIEFAQKELSEQEKSLSGISNNIAQDNIKKLEDSFVVEEQERLNTLAIRLKKFIQRLEEALVRIEKGTYGFCQATGKRIDKQRLLLVPHTTHSVEGKNRRKH